MPFSGFGRMPRRRVRMKSALSADRGGMDKQAFRCKNPLSPADAAAAPTKMSRHGRNQNHAFNAWHTLALKGHMTGAPLKRHRMGLSIAFLFRPPLKLHKKQDRRDPVGPVCIFVYFCLAATDDPLRALVVAGEHAFAAILSIDGRSEERRVGKEC